MAVEAALGPIVEDIVSLFACMVVLIAGSWIAVRVLMGGGLRVILLILETVEGPAA